MFLLIGLLLTFVSHSPADPFLKLSLSAELKWWVYSTLDWFSKFVNLKVLEPLDMGACQLR
jgi:hypothetical protein